MNRPVRILAWSSGSLFGLITLLIFLVWFTLATTTGSRFVFSQVERLLDNQLVIGEVIGTLTGKLSIQGLHYNSDTVNIRLEQIDLDWSPSALFSHREIHIETLRLQGLRVLLPDTEGPADKNSIAGIPDDISLPLPVQVKNFSLDNATITRGTSETDELVSLQRVVATELSWGTDGIKFPHLSVKSNPIEFTTVGQLLPEADWPLTIDASYSVNLQPQQLPVASGTIALSGSLMQLGIVQTLDAPYSIHLEAKVSDPLVAPRWQAKVWAEKMQLAAFNKKFDGNLPAVSLKAKLSAEGDATHANLNADMQVEQSSVQISGKISFDQQLSDSPTVDFQVAWQQLIWPLDAADNYLVASDTGKAQVTGVLDAYRTTMIAQLAVPAYPAGNIDMTGAGSRHGFSLEQLALSTLGGKVQGSASVDWTNGVVATFNLSGENIDPAGLNANWPGQVNFTTRGEAAAGTDGIVTSLQGNLMLDGVLRGEPVRAEMTGRYDGADLTIPTLVVHALGTTLNAEGTISKTTSKPVDFKWQFAMKDLGYWTPGLTGNVQAEGSLTGTVSDPRIKASMTASDIAVAQIKIDHAELTTDLGLGTSPLSLNANLDGLQLGDTQVGRVEFDLSGTLAKHLLGLRTVSDAGTNRLALSGSLSNLPTQGAAASIEEWSNTSWQFSFDALDIKEGDVEVDLIQDSQPEYSGRVDGESVVIGDTCFSVSNTNRQPGVPALSQQRICAQASGSYADAFNSNITFQDIPLMVLNPFLPAPAGLTGSLGGTISLGWNVATSTPRADVVLNTSAADLQSRNSQGDIKTLLKFEPGKLNASWIDDTLVAVIELPLVGSAGLKATAKVAPGQGGEFKNRAIDANVVARFDDLDWMADFLQGVTQLSGNLNSNLQIGGTISGPVLLGNLSLKNGKAVLPAQGLTLRELDVEVVGAGDEGLNLIGSVKSGGGTLSLKGQVNDIGADMTGQMSLNGQRVLILNTPEAEIYASPMINADLQQAHLHLEGEVSIDKANIQLASLPQTAVTVSSDQIIVVTDTPADESGVGFDVTTHLRLLLNDAVSFKGFGLEATFGGDLNLVDLPGKPTTANGAINVLKGQYRAYGQDLTIETGKLLFVGGPIDQPGIDIRAVRQVTEDIKVGALARGNLRAPEFAIFSEPTMNQSDQLAYLILGRPLSTSSSGESSVLSRAALAMGIKGGNYLTEQFGSKLRVDKIGIETPGSNANAQAALVVGKYLSPKLFVSYGIGILDAVSTLKIEYLLSSRWRLSSESSVEQGSLDLNYVLER